MEPRPKKILVAEDDLFLRRAVASILRRNGFDVVTASDGAEAIARIRDERPDLVLLDLVMPKMHGFEVVSAAKRDATTAEIPIVVLSNLGRDADLQRCRDLGAVDYLVKAELSLDALVDYVRRATSRCAERA
jgi:CheY-like chemotaxis protein